MKLLRPDGDVETAALPDHLTPVGAAEFDCDTGNLTVISQTDEGPDRRAVLENPADNPVEIDSDEIPDLWSAEVFRGRGVTPDGLVTVRKDGSFQMVPMEVGEPVTTGEFDINGGIVGTVTFDGEHVVLAHLREGRDSDKEITTFSVAEPDTAVNHVVIADSAFNDNTGVRNELNGWQTATSVFPLSPGT